MYAGIQSLPKLEMPGALLIGDAAGKLNYQTTAYPLPQWKGQAWLQGAFGPHSLRLQVNYVDGYTDQRGADVFGPNNAALAGASVTAGKVIGSRPEGLTSPNRMRAIASPPR